MSNTQNFILIRARDLAVLICTSSLLWGILHCIKSQQVFAKQKIKVWCHVGWTADTSAMRRSKGKVNCVTGTGLLQAFLK